MSACPPGIYKAEKPDVAQLGHVVASLGVPEEDAIQLETAIRNAAQGSPILSYEIQQHPDGSIKFTVVIGPAV